MVDPHTELGISLEIRKLVHGSQEVLAEHISLFILRVDLLQDVYPIAAIAPVILLSLIFT